MSRRSSAHSSASVATAPPAAFTIEEYKRKQKVLAASKKPRRRVSDASSIKTSVSSAVATSRSAVALTSSLAPSSSSVRASRASGAESTYSKAQKQYLDFCVDKFVDPDMKLLRAIREGGFLLKLDAFGTEELGAHMEFLPKHASYRQICLSLGSVDIKRDLRSKFERLGIKRGVAFTEQGATSVVRSVSMAAYKTKHLLRLEIVGIRIPPTLAPALTKAIVSCTKLEFVSFAQTRLGDAGIEAIAMALGKCVNLQQLSLAGCHLTDKARDHISKIVTLHGVLKDEAVWSSSLRGETVSVAAARPALLLDLSQNAFGDESAEAICNALYHDKWLLGLNLSRNKISRVGISLLADTLAQSNRTLAVIQVGDMKEPVDQVNLRRLEALMQERKVFLQHLAFETREKRLLLCSVLLEWNVNRELVLEICQSSEQHDGTRASRSPSATSSVSSMSAASLSRSWRDGNAVKTNRRTGIAGHSAASNQEDDADRELDDEFASDNQSELSVDLGLQHLQQQTGSHRKVNSARSPHTASRQEQHKHRTVSAGETHMAHIQTIKLLTERMCAMEDEQRKARFYMSRLEAENQQLREQLKTAGTSGMSNVEERIIARLEDSISSLAHQVGELVLENVASTDARITTVGDDATEKENIVESAHDQ